MLDPDPKPVRIRDTEKSGGHYLYGVNLLWEIFFVISIVKRLNPHPFSPQVLGIRIRMFLGLPDPLDRGTD